VLSHRTCTTIMLYAAFVFVSTDGKHCARIQSSLCNLSSALYTPPTPTQLSRRVASASAVCIGLMSAQSRIFKVLDNLRPTATGLDDLPAWFLQLRAGLGCSVSVVVGRRTSDREVASSVPGRCIAG